MNFFIHKRKESPILPTPGVRIEFATLAGGHFWGIESDFRSLKGVTAVFSGFTGGKKENPTYEEVCAQNTGHREAIRVYFDTSMITFLEILLFYWKHIDPTDPDGQFIDRGQSYQTAIFCHDDEQMRIATASKKHVEESGIFRGKRDQFLKKLWTPEALALFADHEGGLGFQGEYFVKPSKEELKKELGPLAYRVTQEDDTELPFQNPYYNEERDGIYVDIVSGEPLFSSREKYDSGTGWPSFFDAFVSSNIVTNKDEKELLQPRSEVRSRWAGSHLGHLFQDGPAPTGRRYCVNSASLRFIPKEDMEAQGYAVYLKFFI
ncbi:MAG: Methionine-R-sulfoxide reductase [Parcubacteria group bacterium GW2011_GWA2_47_7]|nr:MAG: Methionine-R-sulfoxide reductase [Parcubacteria group bacterium GW2011_GWA2_47_7]